MACFVARLPISQSPNSLIVDVLKTCCSLSHTNCVTVVKVSMQSMQHLSQQKPNLAISTELEILVV